MSIEEEINAIIDNSPNYEPHVTYPHAELCAYARDYAVRELEALVANHLTDDGVRRYVRLHNFEESITRLKGEA